MLVGHTLNQERDSEQWFFLSDRRVVDKLKGDLVLHDLFDNDLKIGLPITRNQRASTINELYKPTLNQRQSLNLPPIFSTISSLFKASIICYPSRGAE